MLHLRSITIDLHRAHQTSHPFNLPVVRHFNTLPLQSPMTIFVGENGSGKSTILEALAAAVGLPAVGGHTVDNDPSLAAARELSRCVSLA